MDWDGADYLTGGTGADTQMGGSGADLFFLTTGDGGNTLARADTIQDFADGSDRIVLTGSLDFSGLTITLGNCTDTPTANTVIRAGTEYLAVLLNTRANTITVADFYLSGS